MSDFAAMMKSFMPTSFGKKVNKIDTNSVQVFEATKRNDQEPIIDDFELPISHELVLSDHERIVSCISVDPAGSRIVTGGRDETIKLWDFNGMDATFKPFMTIVEVCGGNPLTELQFSSSGDSFLIASATYQLLIYSRDGNLLSETVRGDPYLRDYKKTKGHTAAITGCQWHPLDKNVFMTTSVDSTIRIWHKDKCRGGNTAVISVKPKIAGSRSPVTAACYTPDGLKIIAGMQDGSIHVWPSIENAHMSGSGPSSIIVSRNNLNFVTRGLDDTIKLWSLESPKSPIKSLSSIENYFEQTNIVYSPNEKVIVTGMSVKRNDQAYGKLLFLDASNLEIIKEIPIKPSTSVIRTLWHPKINQILVGLADGSCHVFYDPLISIRGAKLCAYKNIKEKQAYDIDFTEGVILHPHALPLYKDDDELLGRKKQDFTRAERNLRKPELPLIMRGKRGGVDTRALEKDKARTFDPTRYDDPRDAILKYAEGAEKDPYWIAPAYKKNQPENILAKRVYENEEEERQAALKRRRQ